MALLLATGLSRLAPHPPNFAPLTAIAIAGSAAFGFRKGVVLSLATIWLSDFMVNNILYATYFDGIVWLYEGWYWQYGGWIAIALLASASMRKLSIVNWLLTTLSATLLFFLISNLGVWVTGTMYPKTVNGLLMAYSAGLPFLKNTLSGDLVYSSLLIGALAFMHRKFALPGKKVELHQGTGNF